MYSVCYLDITTTVLSLEEKDYLSEKSDACSLSVIVVVRYFRGAVRNLFLPPPPPPGLATCAGPAHSFSPPLSECQRSVERGDTQSDQYQHHYKPVSSVRIAPQSPDRPSDRLVRLRHIPGQRSSSTPVPPTVTFFMCNNLQ